MRPLIILLLLTCFKNNAQQSGKSLAPKPASSNSSALQKLSFVENRGQWDSRCLYRSALQGGNAFFAEKDRFTYVFVDSRALAAFHHTETGNPDEQAPLNAHALRMIFKGANRNAVVSGEDKRNYHHNYMLGNKRGNWQGNVPVFAKIRYENIYEGISINMYEERATLKYDYLVKAGADPYAISIEFEGAEEIQVKGRDLEVKTAVGSLLESIPYAYQEIEGRRTEVSCTYMFRNDGTIGFSISNYDARYDLVIDPVVMASTYSGGTSSSYGHCATYDRFGNVYSGARCFGVGYPVTTGAFQTTFGGNVDVAISKLDPAGSALIYATYLGGSAQDLPHSMFVHSNDELYLFGTTKSNNYPTTTGAFQVSANGMDDIIVSRLSSNGSNLLSSTYVGGSANDGYNGTTLNYADNYRGEIIVNSLGEVFIASVTNSTNFPVTTGAFDVTHNGQQDAVVFKMDASLGSMVWATYLGDSGNDAGFSLRQSGNGDVVVVGYTNGNNFPVTTGALNTTYLGGQSDGFVARFNSNGTSLLNSTFIGSDQRDITFFVDLDASGNVCIFGNTLGSTPISTGVYNVPGSQNFLMKLNASLSAFVWATSIGDGSHGSFAPAALMIDVCGNVYLSGWGNAGAYPVTGNAVQTTTLNSGFHLMVLDGSATTLLYSGPFGSGGEHVDGGTSRFDPNGSVYQGVCACNANFPTTSNAFSPTNLASGCDVAVFKIDFQTNCTGFASHTVICSGTAATFSIVNFNNLSNPSFSVQPGNINPVNQVFTVTPSANSTYTVFITGTNTLNAVETNTGLAVVMVIPQPVLTPTFLQSSCTSSVNGFDLGLSFAPTGSATPNYSVSWSTVPGGISSNTQVSSSGPVQPGVYTATVSSSGCKAIAQFTMLPVPPPVNVALSGVPVIDCAHPTLTLTASPPQYTYSWTSGSQIKAGSTATFNMSGPLNWTVTAIDTLYGCTGFTTFAITQNTSVVTSVLSPTFQNITCTLSSITTITAGATPSVNIAHHWLSPLGGTLVIQGEESQFLPGSPGTYTHVAINTTNGCKAVKTFTVFSSSGFPAFSLSSPQNFSVGCSTRSTAIVNIDQAQTTPTAGGSISYTMLAPGAGGTYSWGAKSSYSNIIVPGTYTFIVRDNSNGCETKVQASILQNTVAPPVEATVPSQILTCYVPSVKLSAGSTLQNVIFSWTLPGSGVVAGDTLRVFNTGVESNTVTGNFILSATDPVNTCVTQTVIPILQNLFTPVAGISGLDEVSCKTRTVMLSNNSSSRIPPYFNPSGLVVAELWTGPSPQLPLQLSSSYLAEMPGTYTMVARDMSNGCAAIATKTITDNRIYPLVNNPEQPGPFVLDCGSDTATIFVNLSGAVQQFAFEWDGANHQPMSSTTGGTISVYGDGMYNVMVTNTVNGCESAGSVEVIRGELEARFISSVIGGYAPLVVTFTNLSSSSSVYNGTANITTMWSFGNDVTEITDSTSENPKVIFNQPGTYQVMMFAGKGYCLDTATIFIDVEIPSRLEIPNVFTPNGDGVNDIYFVNGASIEEIYVAFYNRWGEKVYELNSDKGNIAWDGRNMRGDEVPDGIYMIVLKAKGRDGKTFEQEGTVSLFR